MHKYSTFVKAIANVGEVLHRLHEQLTGRVFVQVAHPQNTGISSSAYLFDSG